MDSKEIAFMVSLIKANYHRRVYELLVNLTILIVTFMGLFYNFVIEERSAYNDLTEIVFSVVFLASVIRGFIVYVLKPGGFDNDPIFPWSIKKEQMKRLRDAVENNSSFEQLRHCVPLKEYFEMY